MFKTPNKSFIRLAVGSSSLGVQCINNIAANCLNYGPSVNKVYYSFLNMPLGSVTYFALSSLIENGTQSGFSYLNILYDYNTNPA
ncbi:hypothetical protein SAMN05192573_104408 [Mucilaginibacter gossypii]|uniref:Uncharacterized protein n=1 Tax=Mucilaginibacter gossypii TaxID=551996 RepID=A0A1G7WFZ6_9SPHI|nr:hypothetical protein SAMN05192573_104408 [Mucilaginibacter gossypii]